MNTPLYQLAQDYLDLQDALLESGGELTPELEERLAAIEGGVQAKADGICALIQEFVRASEVAASEAARLEKLAEVRMAAAKRLKAYLLTSMQSMGVGRIETDRFVVRVQKNSRPSITWALAPEQLPENLKRVTVTLDGAAAYERWKAGETLPDGFEVTVGSHLRIR